MCRRAAAAVSTGQAREAAALLNRLALILPQAGWVTAAAEQARKCAEALETLSAGPLGFVKSSYAPQSIEQSAAPVQKTIEPPPPATVKEEHQASCETTIPPAVLRVDSVGPTSFCARLTVARSVLPVGPRWPDGRVKHAFCDHRTATKTISSPPTSRRRRRDGLTKKLLASGDKIALSQRRMKFEVPNAASNTAV